MGKSSVEGSASARRTHSEYVPTPADIAQACAEIRAGWTPQERAERWQGPQRVRWQFPLVALRDVFGQRVDEAEEA